MQLVWPLPVVQEITISQITSLSFPTLPSHCRGEVLLGELTALPQPPSWWGGGWLPLSKDLTPAPSPLTRNRRLGPSQHDGLDQPP